MNEVEWMAGCDPVAMLAHLGSHASDRKLRLFACACARRYWSLLRYRPPREAIEVSERFAQGCATDAELQMIRDSSPLWTADPPQFEAFAYLAAAATALEVASEAAQSARENARLMAVREAAWEVIPGQDEGKINADASLAECRA